MLRPEQYVEVGFVNRNVARLHGGDLLFFDVDADDIVSRLSKTCPRYEAHISSPDYRYFHFLIN